ncbi:hypothetical protein [Ignavibacterium sp.]|uniref:hypothetical protein n=1 Tax=Ignavibacterium sp. TaxID=2651167 RepID=UPI002206B806|nr:hypothetical protein [Ignavibacterium sp.]BDQ01483.1 MAG: hypothetical protein KatS3mg037_0058 [Ignavibacterium sp.]
MSITNHTNEDPWYVHVALYTVIAILTVILIKVAIIDPKEIMEREAYYKKEARLRMTNLKQAEILWQKKNGSFTDNLDALINFVKTDKFVDSIVNSIDPVTNKSSNPFVKLSHGEFTPDSLFKTPKSQQRFIVRIDSSEAVDSVVTPAGKLLRVEKKIVKGTRYLIEDPDGYGTVGSLDNDALKNTASWE